MILFSKVQCVDNKSCSHEDQIILNLYLPGGYRLFYYGYFALPINYATSFEMPPAILQPRDINMEIFFRNTIQMIAFNTQCLQSTY